MKTAKDIMNKRVISFSPNDSIFDVAKVFAKKNISGAPVIEKNKVIGIISASDIIRFIDIKLAKLPMIYAPGISCFLLMFVQLEKENIDFKKELKKITRIKIRDVMTKTVITIKPNATLVEIANIIEKNDVNRLPVVNDKGKLIGIVTRADVIKGLVS